jgi:hypothetical protein
LLQRGQTALAVRLIQDYASAIYTASVLSPEKARSWESALQRWASAVPDAPVLRQILIELRMAVGPTEAVAREVLEWVRSPSPPPAEWAVLRACRMDRDRLCRTVRDEYRRRQPTPWLDRMEWSKE